MDVLIKFINREAALACRILYGDQLSIPKVKKIFVRESVIQWETESKHDGYDKELVKEISIEDNSDE